MPPIDANRPCTAGVAQPARITVGLWHGPDRRCRRQGDRPLYMP